MFNHEQITALSLLERTEEPSGVYAIDLQALGRGAEAKQAFPIFVGFTRESVAPELFNLFQSAPLMYQALTRIHDAAETIASIFEQQGLKANNFPLPQLQSIADAALLAQQAAREGVMSVSAQLDREQKVFKKV